MDTLAGLSWCFPGVGSNWWSTVHQHCAFCQPLPVFARYSSVAFTIVGCTFSHVWVLVFVDLQSIYSTVAVRRNAGSANSVPGFCFCQVSNLAHSWCADVYIHVYPVFAPNNVPHPESLQCSSGIFCFSSRSCFVLRNAWHKPVKTIAIFGSFDQVCMYVNCALVTGKAFKSQQKPELAPVV